MTTGSLDAAAAVEALRRSTSDLLSLLDGLSDAQWRQRPSGEEWSVAETVEHVVLTDRGVCARLETIHAMPRAADAPRFDDAAITAEMFAAAPAPPGLAEPKGRFATPAEGVAALRGASDALAAWAASLRIDPRTVAAPHPVFGPFDAVQWMLFAAAHTDNHAPQLRALRSHPEIAAAR